MYTIEYSISQKAFHTQYISEALGVNLQDAILKRENDYKIIGLAATQEAAQIKIERFRKII